MVKNQNWNNVLKTQIDRRRRNELIYEHLFNRVKEPEIVHAGLVGAGYFGTTIVTQSSCIPRLEISAIADINIEAGRRAYQRAGIPSEDTVVCNSHSTALRAMESGKAVVVHDATILMDLPLDVIATATRVPEVGARYAYEAIQHGKHVVLVDKEADSVVGPILKHLADRAGVVFTTDDGDQPGLLMGLVSWARALGLEILCGGNMRSCLYDPAAATVEAKGLTVQVPEEDRWALERVPAGQVKRFVEARRRLFSDFRPYEETGDPICHMAVAANGTGLMPDTPVGHRPVARFVELPEILCPIEDGGILQTRGAIDVPTILRTANEPHGGDGVFIVVANDAAYSRSVMIQKGLLANSRETAMLIYRPHHLLGVETAMSILCAGLLQVPTGSSTVLPRVDIIAKTIRDFKAGEIFGIKEGTQAFGYSRDLKASLVPAHVLADDRPLPYFMLYGNQLTKDVPAGTVITREMIEPPQDSALWSLREEQDRHFFPEGNQ